MSSEKILGEQYRIGSVVGHGAFSVVYECEDIDSHQRYAVKVLSKAIVRQAEMEEAFEREAMALRSLTQCAHVTRAVDILQSTRNYYVVMDLADKGSLLQHTVKTNGGHGLSAPGARRYFKQLMQGLAYMHALNIVHRDIKPENLLLDEWRNVKISDFGFAAKASIHRKLHRQCGTPQYVAPEVLRGDGYIGQYADIWSAGVTLYVLLCGQLPFAAHDHDKLFAQIQAGDYPPPRRPEGLSEVPQTAVHLLKCMLCVDPERRWPAQRVLKHPFTIGFDVFPISGQVTFAELGTSWDPDVEASLLQDAQAEPGMVQGHHSCPNMMELSKLGIDIFHDPQLGRARKKPLRKLFESNSELCDMAASASNSDGSGHNIPDGPPQDIEREGLGRRGTLRMLRQATFTDDVSPMTTGMLNRTTPGASERPSRRPSMDSLALTSGTASTLASRRPASGASSRPATTPHDPARFSKPIQRRFRLVHVWLFFQFLVVLGLVIVVAVLKIMFDVRLNRLPLPKRVRHMVANLVDGAGIGEPTPTSTPHRREKSSSTSSESSSRRSSPGDAKKTA